MLMTSLPDAHTASQSAVFCRHVSIPAATRLLLVDTRELWAIAMFGFATSTRSRKERAMSDSPKRIWAEPPDIFDGMGFWRDASFPTGSPYILATPAALSEAPEVQALIAEAVERATRVKPLVSEAAQKMIVQAVRFATLAAGEGICIDDLEPETFLFDYSQATDDEDWDTLHDRIRASIGGNENE
jgi:hypothetical protein